MFLVSAVPAAVLSSILQVSGQGRGEHNKSNKVFASGEHEQERHIHHTPMLLDEAARNGCCVDAVRMLAIRGPLDGQASALDDMRPICLGGKPQRNFAALQRKQRERQVIPPLLLS